MSELVSAVAAVLSASAAVLGAVVSWGQWRDSRVVRGPEGPVSPAAPTPAASRGGALATTSRSTSHVEPRPSRIARLALVLAVVECVVAAVGNTVFVIQQTSKAPGRGLENFLNYVAFPALVFSGLLAVGLAGFLLVRGVATRCRADLKVAGLVVALSAVAWLSLWLTVVLTRGR